MVLRVADLSIEVMTPRGRAPVVDRVSFALHAGQTLALVGESGCGKSLTALALTRLLPVAARVTGGAVLLGEADLLTQPSGRMRHVRGVRVSMIFQEPMTCLNPVVTIGEQIAEPLRVHQGADRRRARRGAIEMLERVGLAPGERCARSFPHELSGGMRQRAMIAMALICGPEVLIADEPTTALDVTTQRQILQLLAEMQVSLGVAILFITHDMGVAAQFADEIAVMYAGRLVETAAAGELFAEPRHPYTRALLESAPRIDGPVTSVGRRRLPTIPGEPPRPSHRPSGCAFHPRCAHADDDVRCRGEVPILAEFTSGRRAACWLIDSVVAAADCRDA